MISATAVMGRFAESVDEFTQSIAFRMSFKVSLALVITYALAIYWGWSKPYWAGMSVLFCAMATAGSSVKACVDRVIGTALSFIASLVLIALFPQERWPFLLGMSAIIGAATYLQAGSKFYGNIWFNLGFNIPIIVLLAEVYGVAGPASFDTAVIRFQETALGALVLGIVALFVWPGRGDRDFLAAAQSVTKLQQELVRSVVGASASAGRTAIDELQSRLSAETAKLGPALYAAAYDSDEIAAIRHTWERHIETMAAFNAALTRWRQCVGELCELDLQRYIDGIGEFSESITGCLGQVDALLVDAATPVAVQLVEPQLNVEAGAELGHFQRAAVLTCHEELLNIGSLAGALHRTASAIRKRERVRDTAAETGYLLPVPDLDRVVAVQRQVFALILASLLVIYLPPVPTFVAVITLANAFAMMCAPVPQIPGSITLKPALIGLVSSGVVYMTVLPALEGFLQYSVVLFLSCFVLSYLLFNPVFPLPRLLATVMMICIITGDNPPTYSFDHWMGWIVAIFLFFAVTAVTWRFPVSFQPDAQFRWQYRRLLRSADNLLDSLSGSGAAGRWQRWRRRCQVHELTNLPERLGRWLVVLPADVRGDSEPGSYELLVSRLRVFSERLNELLCLCEDVASRQPGLDSHKVIGAQGSAGAAPHDAVRAVVVQLADDPAGLDLDSCRDHLERAGTALETSVSDFIEQATEAGAVSQEALLELYRLLGAWRSVLLSTSSLSEVAGAIDWTSLHRERF